jgi:hypothetical protein
MVEHSSSLLILQHVCLSYTPMGIKKEARKKKERVKQRTLTKIMW